MTPLKIIVISICFRQIASAQITSFGSKIDDEYQSKKLRSDSVDYETGDVFNEEYLLDDMVLTRKQMDQLFLSSNRRNGVKDPDLLWPGKLVPILISKDFNVNHRKKISSALQILSSKSCIKFQLLGDVVPGLSFVNLTSSAGCSSTVGFRHGENLMSLNIEGCLDTGRILHEFLHVLGFYHMHTTTNRDDYVTIMWDNIKEAYRDNFQSFADDVTLMDTPYDYDSVTHYSTKTFSKNGKQTIVSKTPKTDHLMGQRTHLSEGDIIRINKMYDC